MQTISVDLTKKHCKGTCQGRNMQGNTSGSVVLCCERATHDNDKESKTAQLAMPDQHVCAVLNKEFANAFEIV